MTPASPAYHDPANGIFDNWIAQLADAQGSIVKTIAARAGTNAFVPGSARPIGSTIDEVEYDPYGRGRRHIISDFSRDGVYGIEDFSTGDPQFLNAWFAGTPAADHDENGVLDTNDIFAFLNDWFMGPSGPMDAVSNPYTDNPYGYCGYYFDAETLNINGPNTGAFYHVRHRVYDPASGRWLTRDPAGFVDGVNLYQYVGGRALRMLDPYGLIAVCVSRVANTVKQAIQDTAQKLANTIADSGAPQVVKDAATFVVAGAANAAESAVDSAADATDPAGSAKRAVEGAVASFQQAINGEDNNAKRGGYTPGVMDYAAAVAAHYVGAGGVAEGLSGYSPGEDRQLDGWERFERGGTGAAQMVGTGASAMAGGLGMVRGAGGAAAGAYSSEKRALVDMAKTDKRIGATRADMRAYQELNDTLADPFPKNKVRVDEGHPSRSPHSQMPHGHVGPIDHIPIKDP